MATKNDKDKAEESVLLGLGGKFFRVKLKDLEDFEVSPEDLKKIKGGATFTSISRPGSLQIKPFPNDMVAGVRG